MSQLIIRMPHLWSCTYPASNTAFRTERLVEETEAHVVILRLLLLLLLLLSSGGGGTGVTASSGSGSSGSIGLGVGNAVLELLDLVPLVLGLNGNSEDLLVGVDNGVHDGGQGGVVDSKRDTGNGGDGGRESLEQLGLLNVEDGAVEGLAVVVDLGDTHTVGEGRDVQQVKEGSLGGTDLVASLNELEVGGNFNGTTGNLGGNTEGLEERGLTRFHTAAHMSVFPVVSLSHSVSLRVSGGDVDITGGDGTSTSGGSDTVGEDLLTDVLEVTVGEDEADVAWEASVLCARACGAGIHTLDVGEQALVVGEVVDQALESAADHGVLAHENDTLTTEGLTDLVHLLGRDIVDADDEDALVLLEEVLELLEVSGLEFFLAPHYDRFDTIGSLRTYCGVVV